MASAVQLSTALTERVLLLLGWERVRQTTHSDVYGSDRKKKFSAKNREKEQEEEERPTKAEWEKNTPALRHRGVADVNASAQEYRPEINQWSSDTTAFDAAVTGTV